MQYCKTICISKSQPFLRLSWAMRLKNWDKLTDDGEYHTSHEGGNTKRDAERKYLQLFHDIFCQLVATISFGVIQSLV